MVGGEGDGGHGMQTWPSSRRRVGPTAVKEATRCRGWIGSSACLESFGR